jgi:drug/metabolite transporter (DMT)-like permease
MLIAAAAGLLTAAMFTATAMAIQRSSRVIGAPSAVAWMMLVALIAGAAAIAITRPATPDSSDVRWLAIAGVSTVIGQVLAADAFKRGRLSIVQPVLSTEGAVAAGLAILAGETLSGPVAAAMILIVLGTIGASQSSAVVEAETQDAGGGVILIACVAAACFGVGLYAIGRVGDHASLWFGATAPAVVAVVAVTSPMAIARRLRFEREVLGVLVIAGLLQLLSYVSFAIGSRHSIAVTGLLAGQSGAMAALAGFLWLSERLTRVQYAGIGLIAAGVGLISVAAL